MRAAKTRCLKQLSRERAELTQQQAQAIIKNVDDYYAALALSDEERVDIRGPMAGLTRRFLLMRDADPTGISGTGVVATQIEAPNP